MSLMTVDQAAELLSVCSRTVYNMAADGRIPVVRMRGRSLRVHREKLEAMLEDEAAASIRAAGGEGEHHMPYKRGDSPFWWVSYKLPTGKYVRRSSGTEDYAAAKALEQQARADAWKEKEWGVNPPRSFEEVIIPYLQHARQHQRSYETTTHRVKHLRRLLPERS
ncbi:helix-turn-helix domain-containing protein [Azotobacter chroococcum]